MRVLLYKRTHTGDPDEAGRFGVANCMGRVRSWRFDAVVGVGGRGREARKHRLDGKVTWIGVGPHRHPSPRGAGDIVTFERFLLLDAKGPRFRQLAPHLAKRIYARNVRVMVSGFNAAEEREVLRILDLARTAAPSRGLGAVPRSAGSACRTRRAGRRCPP